MKLQSQNQVIISVITDLHSSPVMKVDDWVLKQPETEMILADLHYNVMRISQ